MNSLIRPCLVPGVCKQDSGILEEDEFDHQHKVPHHDRMVWMNKPTSSTVMLPLRVLLLSTLACRPIITIGWQEIGILVLLLLVLLGPPLYRLFKRLEEFQSWKSTNGKDKSED